jgi:hypothetical protein
MKLYESYTVHNLFQCWNSGLKQQLANSSSGSTEEAHHHATGIYSLGCMHVHVCIQKFPDWVDNEINNNNKHSLRSNTKEFGGRSH